MKRKSTLVVAACVLAATSACSSSTTAISSATTVVLLGDSLAEEAAEYLPALLHDRTLVLQVFGGTAPCDWLGKGLNLTGDSVLVVSFVGNSMTTCMTDGAGGFLSGQALIDKYRSDIRALIEQARSVGSGVLLVGQPVRGDPLAADEVTDALNASYRELAAEEGVAFVDAGAAVENPDGTFAHELPCLAGETECGATSTNVVRTDDGVHFCPGPPNGACKRYSSGAFRFAKAIADPIVDE